MKISAIRTERVEVPLATPFRTSIHDIRSIGCVLVFIDTADGLTGESYLWLSSPRRLKVLEEMVLSLAHLVVGREVADLRAIGADMWDDIELVDRRGVALFGLSAIDTALWDLHGKAQGASVSRLLGRARDRIPAYADGGLFVTLSIDALVAQAKDMVAQGFRAMKMRLGQPRLEDEVARVAALREAVGPDVALMADANQALTVPQAIRLGRLLDEFDLAWLEEPVTGSDVEATAEVAAAIATPVAIGQSLYGRQDFARAMDLGAAAVLMPDLQRVGGISEFLKIAHAAELKGLPVTPHLFAEQSLQLAAVLPNCAIVEHMPWFEPLFNEPIEMVEGAMLIPDRAGLGFTFDQDAIARFRISD